jgi:hypothetical protein
MTTALQCKNSQKPYTLAGFEPWIFCSEGGRDDHYATPPGQETIILLFHVGRHPFISDAALQNVDFHTDNEFFRHCGSAVK